MATTPKAQETRLHIRASARQKELLTRAARRRHINVSQFVLQTCIEAAQKIVSEDESLTTIRVPSETYDWLMDKLAEPPQEIPELRRLLSESVTWNG